MLDVCMVGLGAVGTIYAYALERSGKARVTAVCRSNYQIVSDFGLDITSEKLGNVCAWRPFRGLFLHAVVANVEDAADRNYSFVLCSFKCLPDIHDTPTLIKPLLGKTSAFVLLQNGIGIEKELQESVPEATIISGCVWIDATVVDSGRRIEQTGEERLVVGYHQSPLPNDGSSEAAAKESLDLITQLLRCGGCDPVPTDNIEAARWRKVLWNASFSTLCTLTRGSMADIMSSKVLSDMLPVVRGVMTEVVSVARKAGITYAELPDNVTEPIVQDSIECYSDANTNTQGTTDSRSPSTFKPSMLVDLERGRPIEVEPIVGGVIRKAREVGVETPRLDLVYATLKVIQQNVLKSRPN